MEIYNAIMKAADKVDSDPDSYRFAQCEVPVCDSPGCALGWIGFFLGLRGTVIEVARAINAPCNERKNHEGGFYDALNELTHDAWHESAKETARALRLYAAKYHAPLRTGLPDSVREIFTVKEGA